jgi:hypothetical protein
MNTSKIIAELDAEIAKLQEARSALLTVDSGAGAPIKARLGRPKGSTNKPLVRKVSLSPAGRKRISDAMKRRWAERKSMSAKVAKKTTAKKTTVKKANAKKAPAKKGPEAVPALAK